MIPQISIRLLMGMKIIMYMNLLILKNMQEKKHVMMMKIPCVLLNSFKFSQVLLSEKSLLAEEGLCCVRDRERKGQEDQDPELDLDRSEVQKSQVVAKKREMQVSFGFYRVRLRL